MKKLLITGGVLFSIMPAMAADLELPDLIQQNGSGDCSNETSDAFYTTPVTMQAVYVTDTCPAGQYFNVGSNAEIDSTTGQITGASCQNCTDGHYCPSAINIAVNNGVLSTQGLDNLCPAGTYADSNRTSLTECDACPAGTYQTQTGQSSCNNARAGYYIVSATQTDVQCPYGYRDGVAGTGASIDACSKTVSCPNSCSDNLKHIKTSGNGACTIDNTVNGTSVAFGSTNRLNGSCFEQFTCENGYEKRNVYAWLYAHPESVSSNIAYCSPNGTGAGCSDIQNPMERGTSAWIISGNDRPVDTLHFVNVCTSRVPDFNAVQQGDFSSFVVDQATAQFSPSDTGVVCWNRNVDLPNQPWFITNVYDNAQECADKCGRIRESNYSSSYAFGDYQNDTFVPIAQDMMIISQLTTYTANACFANTITINWGGIADPGAAGTCTYGETFTAPNSTPAAASGFKFIGWTPVESGN